MILTYKEDPRAFEDVPCNESETIEDAISVACEFIDEPTEFYFTHEDEGENILSVEMIECNPIEYGHPNSPNR